VSVFLADEQSLDLDLARLRSLAEMVLAEEGFPEDTELTILFVDDDQMASYNSRFLDRAGPTDVLAFPVERLQPGSVPEIDPYGPPLMLGDVIVAPAYARRQAEEYQVSPEDEMTLMVVHGILHLLGYDHQEDADAEKMEARETVLMAQVGKVRR